MKKLTTKALLALASLGMIGTSALAQSPLSYTAGELLLGFRASGGTGADKDYVVNIGPAANYTGATGVFAVSGLGNIAADLSATFGSDWSTRSNVFWSVSGTNNNAPAGTAAGEPTRTLFATKAQAVPGTLNGSRWQRGSSSAQASPTGKMLDMAAFFAYVNGDGVTPLTSTANSPKGRVQNKTDVNSFASYQPGGTIANSGPTPGISYAWFNPTIEGSFGGGTGSVLELYRMQPGSGQGDLIGFFSIDGSGTLMFFPASYSGSGGVSGGNATLQFQDPSVQVTEGSAFVSLTIVRGGNLSTALSVTVDTADGTAVAPTDYDTLAGHVVNFAANEIQKTVTINLGALQPGFQPDRDFTVALSGAPVGVTVTSPATVTIEDTTPAPIGFASATYNHTPKNSSGVFQPTIEITVVRDNGRGTASGTVAVDAAFVAAPGHTTLKTASPVSFTLTGAGLISFAEGETKKTVTATLETTVVTPGQFKLKLTGASPAAAIDSTVVTVGLLDTKAPAITLTSPGSSVTAPGTFSLTGSYKDDNAQPLSAFSVMLNGAPVALTGDPYVQNANVSFASTGSLQAENGVNTIVITAVDAQGNQTVVTKTTTLTNTGFFADGTYNGVVLPTGTPDHDTTGFLTVKVTSSGSISGKLTIGGITKSFAGLLRNSGVARFKNPKDLADYLDVIDLTEFESYLGALTFTLSGGQITGALSEDGTGAVQLATVTADKAPFSSTNLITGALINQGTKGIYNVAALSKPQVPTLAANLYPQGDGLATLTLLNTGKATLKGYLADGSVFTAGGAITATNAVALHVPLYRKDGSFTGVLQFNLADADTDIEGTDLLWIRPVKPHARYYKAGWPNGVRVDAIGAAYNSPNDLDFGQDATGGVGSASLVWSEAGLASPVTRAVTVVSTTGAVATTSADYTLKLTTKSGLFSGTFTYAPGVLPGYKGVLINKAGGSLNGGYGYFLSLPPTAYGAAGESGLVELLATP